MKKIISILITAMLLFSCLGLTVFAETSSATISDDYQKLTLDGNTYSRFNTSAMEVEYFSYDTSVELSTNQQDTIKEIILQANEEVTIIYADIYFKDGAVLSVGFLRDDYLGMYNDIATGENNEYTIDFEYPEGNKILVEKATLYGDSVSLGAEELEWCDYFPVVVESSDGSLTAYRGALITIDGDCYYVDFEEAHVESWYDFNPYDYAELPAHEISDEELIASIQVAEDAYYSDDFGFLLDDSFTEAVSAVFLIFVFAIIPFALFVVFLILAIRSKTIYKKMFRVIYLLSGAELVLFAIITSFVMMGR